MNPLVLAPRTMVQAKPAHGAACTRCGLCCYMRLCDLGKHLFKRDEGPCPALVMRDNKASCGIVEQVDDAELKAAALLLTRAGVGCDARINGEPRNMRFDQDLDRKELDERDQWINARRLWGMR